MRAHSSARIERRTSNPTVVGSNPTVPVQRGAKRRANRHAGDSNPISRAQRASPSDFGSNPTIPIPKQVVS